MDLSNQEQYEINYDDPAQHGFEILNQYSIEGFSCRLLKGRGTYVLAAQLRVTPNPELKGALSGELWTDLIFHGTKKKIVEQAQEAHGDLVPWKALVKTLFIQIP